MWKTPYQRANNRQGLFLTATDIGRRLQLEEQKASCFRQKLSIIDALPSKSIPPKLEQDEKKIRPTFNFGCESTFGTKMSIKRDWRPGNKTAALKSITEVKFLSNTLTRLLTALWWTEAAEILSSIKWIRTKSHGLAVRAVASEIKKTQAQTPLFLNHIFWPGKRWRGKNKEPAGLKLFFVSPLN